MEELLCGMHIDEAIRKAMALSVEKSDTVCFDFNEIRVEVDPGATTGDIQAQYQAKAAARTEECRLKREAHLASPAGQAETKRAEDERAKLESRRAEAFAAAPASMTFSDRDGWDKGLAKNTDPYGSACFRYAETWARLMEGAMANGSTLEDCAKEMSHLADTEGITGYMHGAAVGILSQCWAHGSGLRNAI